MTTPPTPEQVAEARKIVAQHRAFETYTGDEKAIDEALAENIAQALSAASRDWHPVPLYYLASDGRWFRVSFRGDYLADMTQCEDPREALDAGKGEKR